MKYIVAIFFSGILIHLSFNGQCQSSAQYQIVTNSTASLAVDANGNSIDVSAATNLLNNWVSNQTSVITPIGFDFFFMGKYYSHFTAASNGVIALGHQNSAGNIFTGSSTNDLTRATQFPPSANTAPIIAAFWDKMVTAYSGATIRRITIGSAPNRCCVIEWKTAINNGSYSGLPSAQFQVRLYEATGKIEYVYGGMAIVATSAIVTASIGFTAGNLDQQFVALQNLTNYSFTNLAAEEPATQSIVNSNSVAAISGLSSTTDGSRRSFQFTPPALVGNLIGSAQVSSVGASSIGLQWSDGYSNELGYTVLRSTDNINFVPAATLPANSTNCQITGLTNNTNYYFKIYAHTEGASSDALYAQARTGCSMAGTYSIGTTGDFSNITDAINQLKSRGITGSVIFELTNQYQPNTEITPIRLPKQSQIPCADSNFKLTIRPKLGVSNITINGNNDTAIFYLDSCTYLTIDGRAGGVGSTIALSLINNRNAPVISLLNSSKNAIRFCNMSGSAATSFGSNCLVLLRGTLYAGCDNNTIDYCKLSSNNNQITKQQLLISTTTGNILNQRNNLIANQFFDFSTDAIYLAPGNDDWQISYNSFYQTGSSLLHPNASMINVAYTAVASHPTQIINNYFGGTEAYCSGNNSNILYGISFAPIRIQGNAIIRENQFKRMKFSNDSMAYNPTVAMISIDNSTNELSYTIQDNEIGGAAAADSVHVVQQFANYKTSAYGILAIGGMGEIQIKHNRIQNFNSQAALDGGVEWIGIQVSGTGAHIYNNHIGENITNRSNGQTAGIRSYSNNGSRINQNRVHHLLSTSDGAEALMYGILVNGGSIDSIANNQVYQLKNNQHQGNIGNALFGIYTYALSPGGLSNTIYHNTIHSLHNGITAGSKVAGISSGSEMVIDGNIVHSLNVGTTINMSIYGIEIPDKLSVVTNNMVRLGIDSSGQSIKGGNLNFIGISGGHVAYHNSVYIGGDSVTDGFLGSIAFAFLGNAQPVYAYNNIFVNNRSNQNSSISARHQAIDIDLSYGTNNNIYQFNGTGGIIGTYQANRYSSLTEWQTATNLDDASIVTDPKFVAPTANSTNVNLHVQYGSPVEAAGVLSSSIGYDVDGQERGLFSPVDIGADAGNFANCPVANALMDLVVERGTTLRLGMQAPSNNNFRYAWYQGDSLISTQAQPVIVAYQNASYTLQMSSGNCSSSDVMQLQVLPAPSTKACPNQTFTLSGLVLGGNTHQWQINTANGFVNLTDDAVYSNTQSLNLTISNAASNLYGSQYRCVTNDLTSITQTISFENSWTGALNNSWSNPANWSCGVVPDGGTDVIINSGTVVLDTNGICRTLQLQNGVNFTIQTGYSLTITH